MRLVLVNPPNGLLDRADLAPPLGLLTLAAVAARRGHEARIADFNLEVLADPELGGHGFYDFAVRVLASLNPEVVAFTSMCLESHVSLELARRFKAKFPDVAILLGGTHFGPIASEVLLSFPFVDFVVVGEGEEAIVAILDYLRSRTSDLPRNVLYRQCSAIVSGSKEQCRAVLEQLPFPAYDLVDLQRYFTLNPRQVLDYDGGRGCVFKCAFCYSPFQYGDAVRNKQPQEVVRDLRRLAELGARHVFFVQDNFLNSPRWAADLCKQIADAQLPLTWSCYVTYPQLTKELIDLLARSRCIGVFTGVDAVSSDYQLRMNKRFFQSPSSIYYKLRYCVERGVIPTCAFILEGPDQPAEEREETIQTAIECMAMGCDVHLNTLSIYNGTELDKVSSPSKKYSAAKAKLLMDAPLVVQDNEFAKQWPSLFPYHSTNCDVQQWQLFVGKVHTLFTLLYVFPQSIYLHVIQRGESIWSLLDYVDSEFVRGLEEQRPQDRRASALGEFVDRCESVFGSDDSQSLFRKELVRFILSQRQGRRYVDLLVDGRREEYCLSWFSRMAMPQKDSLGDRGTDIYSADYLAFAPSDFGSQENRRLEFALRSGETIRYLSVPVELAAALTRCEKAATSGEAALLEREVLQRLKREGWISRSNRKGIKRKSFVVGRSADSGRAPKRR